MSFFSMYLYIIYLNRDERVGTMFLVLGGWLACQIDVPVRCFFFAKKYISILWDDYGEIIIARVWLIFSSLLICNV